MNGLEWKRKIRGKPDVLARARLPRSARSARECTFAERLSDDDVASACDRKIAVRRKTHIAAAAVEEISAQWKAPERVGRGGWTGGEGGKVAGRVNGAA